MDPTDTGDTPARQPRKALEVARGLRRGIYDHTFEPGAQLPSVRQLHEAEGIANATGQQVHRLLRAWGLAESRPGAGLFVRAPDHVVYPRHRMARMADGLSPLSPGETSLITAAGWCDESGVQVHDNVRPSLGVGDGDRIALREGIVLRAEPDGTATVVELTRVWHTERAATLVPVLRAMAPIANGGTVGALRRAGVVLDPAEVEYAFEARALTAHEAGLLRCEAGRYVPAIVCTRLDQHGAPTEYLEMVYPPGIKVIDFDPVR